MPRVRLLVTFKSQEDLDNFELKKIGVNQNNYDYGYDMMYTSCLCSPNIFNEIEVSYNDYYMTMDQSCGEYYVLCPDCELTCLDDVNKSDININDLNYCKFYEAQIVKIKKIRNYELYSYNWTRENFHKLFPEYLKLRGEPSEIYYKKLEINKFMKKNNLLFNPVKSSFRHNTNKWREPDDSDSGSDGFYSDSSNPNNDVDWYISINNTDSYDAQGKDLEYKLDMSHDGTAIYLLCECPKCNLKFESYYSGD